MDPQISGTIIVLLALAGVVIVVLWILLPFAMFGVKPLLRTLIAEVRLLRQTVERTPGP